MSKRNADAVDALGLREDHAALLVELLDRIDELEQPADEAPAKPKAKK